eukprot:gene20810-biopygen11628
MKGFLQGNRMRPNSDRFGRVANGTRPNVPDTSAFQRIRTRHKRNKNAFLTRPIGRVVNAPERTRFWRVRQCTAPLDMSVHGTLPWKRFHGWCSANSQEIERAVARRTGKGNKEGRCKETDCKERTHKKKRARGSEKVMEGARRRNETGPNRTRPNRTLTNRKLKEAHGGEKVMEGAHRRNRTGPNGTRPNGTRQKGKGEGRKERKGRIGRGRIGWRRMGYRTEELDSTGRAIGRVRFPCKSDASDFLVNRMRPIYKEFGRVKNAVEKNAFLDAFLTRPNVSVENEIQSTYPPPLAQEGGAQETFL